MVDLALERWKTNCGATGLHAGMSGERNAREEQSWFEQRKGWSTGCSDQTGPKPSSKHGSGSRCTFRTLQGSSRTLSWVGADEG